MAIEFRCEHCGKSVRAPDDAGGKHGKCPTCHQSIYIPSADDQIEPLDIAPIDETEEQERKRLERERLELERQLREEREAPAGSAVATPSSGGVAPPRLDMETLVIEYARAMAAGNLEQAEQLSENIRSDINSAQDVMQRLISDEIPPESLAGIPRPVLVGFFKRISGGK